MSNLDIGDRVFWRYALNSAQMQLLPAIVRKISPKRVIIEVLFQVEKDLVRLIRRVDPLDLSVRMQSIPDLDVK